ncbi:MAG TPA: SIS domain-containing protein, partial [Candidatus Baltobacteraceae bacterium]|nr:SIS domain-containing protein [Candidatus Baltobacteraceae bacterium]
MNTPALGISFEREIREQPGVWERLADSDKAVALAEALEGDVLLVGSGSSLFAARVGALALRRRHIRAEALAATEARLDHAAYEGRTVVAISQSGRSSDLLDALDVLKPVRVIALTNTPDSPLGARADLTIDIDAGSECAVPATKSVTATLAVLLWAASLLGDATSRDPKALLWTARTVRRWLAEDADAELAEPAHRIALRRHVVLLGSDYGWPIAQEVALKLKEAAYMHA